MRRAILVSLAVLLVGGVAAAQLQYQTMIPIPSYSNAYNSGAVRGFACQIPVDLTVIGLRVPNESNLSQQHVAIYRNATPPPLFSATVNLTPVFSKFGEKAGTIIPCSVPYKKGEWFITLGACATSIGATNTNSYAAVWKFNTTIFGQPTTLVRVGCQSNFTTVKPPHPIFREQSGSITRVEVYVASASLVGSGMPTPGGTVTFSLSAGGDAGLPYQLGSSFGAGPIPLGSRKLELSVDKLLELSTSGLAPTLFQGYAGTLDTKGQATAKLVIPNIPALKGVRIYSAFVTLQASAPMGIKSISNNFLVTIA